MHLEGENPPTSSPRPSLGFVTALSELYSPLAAHLLTQSRHLCRLAIRSRLLLLLAVLATIAATAAAAAAAYTSWRGHGTGRGAVS